MARVAIIQRTFTSYRKPVFDLLSRSVGLLVLHGENKSGIKSTSTDYSQKIHSYQYSSKETNVYLKPIVQLYNYKPSVVIHEFATGILSMPIVYFWCKVKKIKFVLWSHGYNRKKGFHPEKSIMDKYRLWLLKKSDAVILYGEKDKRLLSKYINSNKIFVATNTLDTNELLTLRDEFEKQGRSYVKEKVGFKRKYNFIYIGRLLNEKLPHLLIELANFLTEDILKELTIHFVGEGPAKGDLMNQVDDLETLAEFKFHGEIYDNKTSGAMLFASDIMILPGEIGLSVNHALCFQCPVLTFSQGENGPFHGPEEEYIINYKTGYKVADKSAKGIGECVKQHLQSLELQSYMRSYIKSYVEDSLDIKFMVNGILDSIKYVGANKE